MPDILNLPYLKEVGTADRGDHYAIQAEGQVVPTACPVCHSALYRHGSQPQTYMDTPIHGKRVLLLIDRKRYRCKLCGKTLFEPLPDMDDKRQATSRLIAHIERYCAKKTFVDLSREVGVDEKTIRHIFDDFVSHKKATVHFETPEILGIDELKIIGQYRAMLTNISKLCVYDVLPTRNKVDLIAYFKEFPDKKKVEAVTMDMWNVYRQVAKDQFPGRLIVADRFHVVRMATNSLEAVRKAVRKRLTVRERIKLKDDRFVLLSRFHNLDDSDKQKLTDWCDQFPDLAAAYLAKEGFHDIYRHAKKDDAKKAAKEWDESLDESIAWAFKETRGALNSWWDEIFNYYDLRVTNGYTESVNNLAKAMNRMGRGYSFDVIRARLMYDEDAVRDAMGTVRKKVRKPVQMESLMGSPTPSKVRYETVIEEQPVYYGAYIPTLVRKLEAGEFE